MKFLIDADSPYSLVDVLGKHGHEAVHVRDLFTNNKGLGLILMRLPYYFKVISAICTKLHQLPFKR